MKRTLIELSFLSFVIVVSIFAALSLTACVPKSTTTTSTESTNYTAIYYGPGWKVFVLKYEGKTYLVNPQGGIVEHKPTLEK